MNDIEQYFGGRAKREADVLYGQIVSRNANGTYQVKRIMDSIMVTASKSNADDEFSKGTWVTMSYLGASKLAQGAGYMIISRAPAEQRGLTGASIADQDTVQTPFFDAMDPMPVPVEQGALSAFFDIHGAGFLVGPGYDTSDLTNHALTVSPKHMHLKVGASATAEPGLHALVIGFQIVRDAIRVDVPSGGPPPPLPPTGYGIAYGGGLNGFGSVWAFDFATNAITVLYSFDSTDSVFNPFGRGVIIGDDFYFICTSDAGSGFGGIVKFSLITNTWTLVHAFIGTDGNFAFSGLMLASGFIYGVTSRGGANTNGVLFKVDPSDDSFHLLHSFDGNVDGAKPVSLKAIGSILYGVTAGAGSGAGGGMTNGNGTIFMVDTSTDAVTLLYAYPCDPSGDIAISAFNLESANDDGAGGLYILCQNGFGPDDFYGTGESVGQIDHFDIGTLTMTWAVVQFTTSMAVGHNPLGEMTLASTGIFYGKAGNGGTNSAGGIFAFNPAINSLADYVVYDDLVNGGFPGRAGTTLVGPVYYVITTSGGADDNGTIGIIDPSGNPYLMVHEFTSAEGSFVDTVLALP